MGYPTFDEALIYKSPTLQTETRVAVGLDYPVFSGHFREDFNGVVLDTTQWFVDSPSWGIITVGGGILHMSTAGPAIRPPFIQSRHNLAFPLRRDTDWTFEMRARFPVTTSFGNFIRICGRSFRDAEAVWALKVNAAQGLRVNTADGYSLENNIWSTVDGAPWRRYRVIYDHLRQVYQCWFDQDDDGVYETVREVAVEGRYADAIVIGNSSAIQGQLGDWTQIDVDYIDVAGAVEAVEDPEWAAPFEYDGSRMSFLPQVLRGRISVDKDNIVDAAEVGLDNIGLSRTGEELPQLYTWSRFLNRRGLILARAGDGAASWLPWQVVFNGICAEKQVELRETGRVAITLPMRDRWRATADDMEILGAYSDAGGAIPGVGMNMTVQEIIEDIYGIKCNLPAGTYNVVALPNNIPRNYNIFRTSAQQAVRQLAEEAGLAVYQRIVDARIEVQEWEWGIDTPGYAMSTSEEIKALRWSESAFDVTSAEQLAIENTDSASGGFTHLWPPHREPFYGRQVHSNAVTVQTSAAHSLRPLAPLLWWARNRKLGSVVVTALGQLWAEHNLEVAIRDNRYLGFGAGETFILDGWQHTWEGGAPIVSELRFINAHPDRFLRRNLPQ